jgi:hypothetical protein
VTAKLIRIRGLTEEETAVALIIEKQAHNTFEDFEEARSRTREGMKRRLAGFQNVPETKLEELIPMVPLVYQIAEELALNAYTFGRAMRYRWCTKDADVALIFAKCCEMITSLPSYAERVQELVANNNEVVWWSDVCATSVLLVFAKGMATEVGNMVRKNEHFPDMNQLFPKTEKGRTLDIADLVGYGRLWPSDHDLYEMQERLKLERVKFLRAHAAADEARGHKPKAGQPAVQRAWASYGEACKRDTQMKTDKEVYEWLTENGCEVYGDDRNDPTSKRLPSYDTWGRYVRKMRAMTAQQKNTPRTGRTGRSIVHQRDL